ncbi:hypothetical protein BDV37DRAFT_279002 [Aspergillus pseudonomiae]|uniref:Mid2 domain-containing protein n=1 Tax=Aspergillus pseudonomiae TaxID=1506151 RepID=A0A5N7DQ27_9EURO|nr:uncharacterized protein BDV37DRAFT_279002 [Aspergillus pseudonomiae]KAE8408516.1 hypothetical protein BDV37DRAFT_279002 [Aspergillus pseudonomiae]
MTHYSDYYFTSNLTSYTCPTFNNLQCQPPNACAREPTTGKLYCCDYNDGLGNVCWSITSECANNNSTRFCRNGDRTWCCLYETFVYLPISASTLDDKHSDRGYSESCTEADNQVNICWNNERSPLGNISSQALKDTYSSLSAEAPSATTWAFDPQSLLPATSTSSTPSTPSTSISTPSKTTAVTTSSFSPNSSSPSLSGGAIAGIVVGVVAVVAIVLGGAAYLLKRHRRQQNPTPGVSPAELLGVEARPKEHRYEADGKPIHSPRPVELPASRQ